MERRFFATGSAAFTINLIAGCAINTPATASKATENTPFKARETYTGRLSLVIGDAAGLSTQQQSFSGGFELRGNAQIGELDLLTPLGQIVMQLRWRPDIAVLLRGGQRQIFANADDLIQQATGASLSLTLLFEWIEGRASAAQSGDWQVDLANHANGRITARRTLPTPAVMRIALEQP